MTHIKRLYGKHYTEYTGHWLTVTIFRLTGWNLGVIKEKTIYKGLKPKGGK